MAPKIVEMAVKKTGQVPMVLRLGCDIMRESYAHQSVLKQPNVEVIHEEASKKRLHARGDGH